MADTSNKRYITSDKIQFAKRYSIILINFTIYSINIWWKCGLTQDHTDTHSITCNSISHKLTNGFARYSLRYINYIYIIFKFSTNRFDLCRDNGNVCVCTWRKWCASENFNIDIFAIKIYYFEKIKNPKRIHITVNVKNAGQTRIASQLCKRAIV